MRDISNKPNSLREARAQAVVRMPDTVRERIHAGTIDKGDVREAARIAGLMAIKRCWELLPHCHPLTLHHSSVEFELTDEGLRIETCVSTIGPTGVEMEALTGASIAALTVYDMLKPHAGMDLSIVDTRLLSKIGGKSDHKRSLRQARPAHIITVSSAVASGGKPDAAAQWLEGALIEAGFAPVLRHCVAADTASLRTQLNSSLTENCALICTVGGTGLAHDDCTIETLQPLLERDIPGIMEAARQFGQQRTPLALISRGIAGQIGKTLLMTLPGSLAGAQQSWHAVVAGVVHAVGVINRAP